MNEAHDISPAEKVDAAERALTVTRQQLEQARQEHDEASRNYIDALRDFHRAYTNGNLPAIQRGGDGFPHDSAPPRLPDRNTTTRPLGAQLPIGRDDER